MAWLRERILYPQLRSFPERERAGALRRARSQPFDVVELVGIALGLVLATALTRYHLDGDDAAGRLAAFAVNVALAVPALAVLVGPFLVRRVRRGLDDEIARRGSP